MLKRNMAVHGLAILLMAIVVSGCASAGVRREIPLTMPDGEKYTIVAHNQIAPDWMISRSKLALNYVVKGDVSAKQLEAIAKVEGACRIYTDTVRPSNLVAVATGGVVYGVASFVGVGLGSQFFQGVNSLAYGGYGGVAGFTGGVANGLVSIGGQTYTFENCAAAGGFLTPYGVRPLNKSPY